jgi:hypothetical protein
MTSMTRIAAHPTAGPHDTVANTPVLAAGSARRTTSIDVARPHGFQDDAVIGVRARDVRTDDDGRVEVVDEVAGEFRVEPNSGTVEAAHWSDGVRAPAVVGVSLRRGWTRAITAAIGDDRSLAASLLQDLGGAFLVSGYSALRAGKIGVPTDYAPQAADAQADVCAGWKRGGDAEVYLRTTARFAAPMGPDASRALVTEGWHDVDAIAPHTVRRVRRLDVTPRDRGLDINAHFRDTYASPDAPEMVMHEYTVRAESDERGVITAIDVVARVLPWDSCPNAVASAQSAVGLSLDALAAHAHTTMRGPTTCTHLTSTVRSLADVVALKRLVSR